MTTCPTCHQTLSPSERANGTCAACGAQFPPVSLQTETELMGTLAGDVDPFAAGDTVAGPDAREVDEASHYDETALQTLASEPVPHTEQLTADYAGIDSDIDGDSRFDHSQTWKPPVADGLATVLEDEREPIPGTILQTPTPVKPKAAVPSTQPGGGSAGGKLEAALEEQLVIKERDIRDLSDDSQLRADFTRLKRIDQDESGRARGGMGAIWKARQTSLAREVALKMIKGETRTSGTPLSVSDDRSKDRPYQKRLRDQFLSEAHVTANLEHPYIVPIYDMARTSDNQLAYLMRFVRGADWADVIDSKTEEENLEILLKVADAVGYAHSKGVVHRDLKPSNIRVGDHGEVYVMDWGTAFVQPDFDTGIELTTGSNSLGWGTPAYAPPELFMGPLEAIGPASDVYLLGAMLFEIITGHPPHPLMNNRKAQLMSLCNNEIRQTDYKGELLDIALQAMKTKPAERFANVDEFIQRIRDYQKHAISRSLVQKAGTLLSRAQKSNDPQEFARAVITFQEAKEQWEHNTEAEAGASVARLAYAQAALAREDFDLGLSVADPQNPAHAEVVAGLKNGKATRQRRKRLLKMAYTAISVLLVTLVGGGVFSYQQIKAEKDYAVKQEGIATKQKEIATEQEGIAKAEKAKAEEQRDAAKVQSLIAELIGAQAQANEAVAIIKAAQAEQEQREALRQKESADKERTRADQKAELASRKQKEAEQQRQAAVASADRALAAQAAGNKEAYVAEIGAAAVKAESADSAGTRLSLDRIRNI
ncbi:MAG: protein kinase, partial [Planctomycetes bacterium]|nr:protein kinase [Planctomycetota bacterium]